MKQKKRKLTETSWITITMARMKVMAYLRHTILAIEPCGLIYISDFSNEDG